jgi:hypothetical protein
MKSLRQEAGNPGLRAIVVLDVKRTTKEEVLEMNRLGVRGVRLNMEASGHGTSASALKEAMLATAAMIKDAGIDSGWFIQLHIAGELWDGKYHKQFGIHVHS